MYRYIIITVVIIILIINKKINLKNYLYIIIKIYIFKEENLRARYKYTVVFIR